MVLVRLTCAESWAWRTRSLIVAIDVAGPLSIGLPDASDHAHPLDHPVRTRVEHRLPVDEDVDARQRVHPQFGVLHVGQQLGAHFVPAPQDHVSDGGHAVGVHAVLLRHLRQQRGLESAGRGLGAGVPKLLRHVADQDPGALARRLGEDARVHGRVGDALDLEPVLVPHRAVVDAGRDHALAHGGLLRVDLDRHVRAELEEGEEADAVLAEVPALPRLLAGFSSPLHCSS